MSFDAGTGPLYDPLEPYFQRLLAARRDIMVFASAGQDPRGVDGGTAYQYPASFPGVYGVGAINPDNMEEPAATYNNRTRFVAVGRDALSTSAVDVPLGAGGPASLPNTRSIGVLSITYNGTTENLNRPPPYVPAFSPRAPFGGVTGDLVDCGNGTAPACNATNKVCLFNVRGSAYAMCKMVSYVARGWGKMRT